MSPPVEESRTVAELLQELRIHQIELEMQNEALRRAQSELEASRDRYVDLYDFAPVGYLTITTDGMVKEINLTASTLLGVDRKDLLQHRFASRVVANDQTRWMGVFLNIRKECSNGSVELGMQRGDGTAFHARLEYAAQKADAGEMDIRITLSNISAHKHTEDEMRIAAAAFEAQNGMVITDPQGIIQRINTTFTRLTGYSAEEAIGQSMSMLKSGRHDKHFYQNIWHLLKEKGRWQGAIWNKRKNGLIYAEMLTITAIEAPGEGITHYFGSYSDITEDKEAEAEIHRLAYYDALTELPNRRLLQDRIGQAIAASTRSKLFGAIFFIDLDNFKSLNDTRGHAIGDLLLIEIAQRLRAAVRESDTVARQGGDEFVVLMEDLGTGVEEAAALAKRLGEALRIVMDQPFDLSGYEYHCRLSIGVGLFDAFSSVENLFKHADLALYQAKQSGRDALRFFDPTMQAAMDRRSALESDLRQAIKRNEMLLFYQPQVDVFQRVTGVEALLRWQHPERGLVSPDDFIALAEDTGLILPIGRWVLETACAQIKAWEKDDPTSSETCPHTHALQIAVNVSARQFRQSDFVPQVQQVLQDSGINPARLKIELTESVVLEDVTDTIAKMLAIKQLGVLFSMDDFGTGYSSLSYLAQLPLDQIKIDKSFVRNLPGPRNDEAIARAIITLGHGLTMDVIAEGVETHAQREFLATHGCHAYQGYLFSRPVPVEQLMVFLQEKRVQG